MLIHISILSVFLLFYNSSKSNIQSIDAYIDKRGSLQVFITKVVAYNIITLKTKIIKIIAFLNKVSLPLDQGLLSFLYRIFHHQNLTHHSFRVQVVQNVMFFYN